MTLNALHQELKKSVVCANRISHSTNLREVNAKVTGERWASNDGLAPKTPLATSVNESISVSGLSLDQPSLRFAFIALPSSSVLFTDASFLMPDKSPGREIGTLHVEG